jgi:tetratricopeptide (TPR) repeat protein
MRGSLWNSGKGMMARSAMAVALVAGLGLGAMAAPAIAKDAKPAQASNSKEFAAAAAPFQKSFTDWQGTKGKVSDADYKAGAQKLAGELAPMEGAVKTPLDRLVFGQWQQILGGAIGDGVLQQKGLQNMADSGQLGADKTPMVQYFLGATAYQNKDYATATKALKVAVDANYSEDNAAELLADSYVQQNQPAQGLEALKAAVATRKAANGTVPVNWYKRGQLIAYNAKLGPQAIEWGLQAVAADPTPLNWLGAGQLTREFSQFGKEESLDLGRLFQRTGALGVDKQYTGREYVEYIQAADPRRLPGEVQKIVEQGIAAGAISPSDPFVSDALSQAKSRIAAGDKASLTGMERDAGKAADGKLSAVTADAYLSYGDAAKAEALYKAALSKGIAAQADKDRAETRLGIALSDQGKYDEAKAAFATVTSGPRLPLAQLWTQYVITKGAK